MAMAMLVGLLSAAPWQIRSDSPLLVGLLIGAVTVLLVLLIMSRVPLSYNLNNLQMRWLTTSMTALAFSLVTALLVSALAFVNGMYKLTEGSGQPGNVIVMAEGATDESFSNINMTDASDIESQAGITKTDAGRPVVSRETYIIVNQPIEKPQPGRPKRRFLSLRGVEDPEMSALVHGMKLTAGSRWFSEAGVSETADNPEAQAAIEVVLGSGLAAQLGADRPLETVRNAKNPKQLDVGDTFDLNNRVWKVVGIMESPGSTFDSEVWAKRSLVAPMFGKNGYSTIVVRADPSFDKDQRRAVMQLRQKRADESYAKSVAAYEKKMKEKPDSGLTKPVREVVKDPTSEAAWGAEMLKEFFNTRYEKAKVNSIVETKYFENLSSTNQQFLVAIIFVSIVLAIGGVFGVMNTMFAAVSQRVKDIGVLRLLGFKRWQVMDSFLLESILIALAGTIVGCLLAWLLCDGATVSSIVTSGQGGGGKAVVLEMSVDLSTLAIGLLGGVLMGFVGGLIPAWVAMRKTALEALR